MTVYLALSCFQGRPAVTALDDLLRLEPDGIQLTAGCIVPANFRDHVDARGFDYAIHHAFDWQRYRRQVWTSDGECVALKDASVHAPPRSVKLGVYHGHTVETMYPGDPNDYSLATGREIEEAMDADTHLAVDISHIRIQFEAGAITEETWRRLQDYRYIEEVHVSDNDGRRDTHKPISESTFGLGWARAWGRANANREKPVVVECFMHRLKERERAAQLAFVR